MEGIGREELARAVKFAAQGDAQAWLLVVEEYSPRVFALLRARCRDADLAEEITQAVFCTVAERLGAYFESGHFESWVFRIAMNRLRDELRRRKRQAVSVEHEALDSNPSRAGKSGYQPPDTDARRALETAMESLSEADRLLIDLRYTGAMAFQRISDLLGEPVGTLLARHHRAVAKLREILAPGGQE